MLLAFQPGDADITTCAPYAQDMKLALWAYKNAHKQGHIASKPERASFRRSLVHLGHVRYVAPLASISVCPQCQLDALRT